MVLYQVSADKYAIICGLNHRQVDVGWSKLLDLTWMQDAVLDLVKKTERAKEKLKWSIDAVYIGKTHKVGFVCILISSKLV